MAIGSFGIARFPDFFGRVHSAGVPATLGVAAMLIASALHLSVEFREVFLKPIIAIVILFLAAPLSTEMLARSAYITNVKPARRYVRDDTAVRDVEHQDPVE